MTSQFALIRLRRLRKLFSSLEHPQVTYLDYNQNRFPLPLRRDTKTLGSCSNMNRMRSLFSRFGRVKPYTAWGGVYLHISTRLDHTWILMEFFEVFGGAVYFCKEGVGATAPTLCWHLSGEAAKEIASCLGSHPSRKQSLLKIGADWPERRAPNYEKREAMLNLDKARRDLRRNFFPSGRVQSWADFAELFECRGHIAHNRSAKHLRLVISHMNTSLLRSVSSFLEKQAGLHLDLRSKIKEVRSKKKKITNVWTIQAVELTRIILEKLLEEGLVLKRERAEAGLALLGTVREEEHSRLPVGTNHSKYCVLQKESLLLSITARNIQNKLAILRRGENYDQIDKKIALKKNLTICKVERDKVKIRDSIAAIRKNARALIRLET